MTQFARNRSNILTPEERTISARKCLSLLKDVDIRDGRSFEFVRQQNLLKNNVGYAPSEPQLAWLRDLVSKYVT